MWKGKYAKIEQPGPLGHFYLLTKVLLSPVLSYRLWNIFVLFLNCSMFVNLASQEWLMLLRKWSKSIVRVLVFIFLGVISTISTRSKNNSLPPAEESKYPSSVSYAEDNICCLIMSKEFDSKRSPFFCNTNNRIPYSIQCYLYLYTPYQKHPFNGLGHMFIFVQVPLDAPLF